MTRKRAVLTTLIERIGASVDQIDIRLRPQRLSALLDVAAAPAQGLTDDETAILSAPVRLRPPVDVVPPATNPHLSRQAGRGGIVRL